MALDSPVISDQDSLIEKEPIQTIDETTRGSANYSTFTRKRPVNLPNSLQRKKRQSLMSPQSIPNLDLEDTLTPDFAMTQSMYEPLEKRKQQAKLEANSRLLNLLASEKASQAAKDRKLKEIKKKAIEQKKKNEIKQKLAEERRLRMLVDMEEKKKKLLNKISIPNQMASSCYGNMAKSVMKYKNGVSNSFNENRPKSSTGKVFGFGSSTPRVACEVINLSKLKDRNLSIIDMKRSEPQLSRMCASQILTQSNIADTKLRKNIKADTGKSFSASTYSISNSNKLLIKQKKASTHIINENDDVKPKLAKPKINEIKSPTHHNNTNVTLKILQPNSNKDSVKQTRGRSVEKDKSISKTDIHSESRSRTTERKKPPVKQLVKIQLPIQNQKLVVKPEIITKKSPTPKDISQLKKPFQTENQSKSPIRQSQSHNGEQETTRKFEVRFEENNSYKEDDSSSSFLATVPSDRRTASTSNLTEDEYRQRIALNRKRAKEKRMKEKEAKELEKPELHKDINNNCTNEADIETIKDKFFDNSETNASTDEIESDSISSPKAEPTNSSSKKCNEISIDNKEQTSNVDTSLSINAKQPMTKIPLIETPSTISEMTASSEALDRIERKKRLESIMSRIKKPIGGSTENVLETQHISTTTLQDMMDKGHLSGMSKTAAILMRNSHSRIDLSVSSSDLNHSSDANQQSSPPYAPSNHKDESHTTEEKQKIDEKRGSCDGQEKLNNHPNLNETLTTKSTLMENLNLQPSKPYLSSWEEKYSNNCSLDTDDENTE